MLCSSLGLGARRRRCPPNGRTNPNLRHLPNAAWLSETTRPFACWQTPSVTYYANSLRVVVCTGQQSQRPCDVRHQGYRRGTSWKGSRSVIQMHGRHTHVVHMCVTLAQSADAAAYLTSSHHRVTRRVTCRCLCTADSLNKRPLLQTHAGRVSYAAVLAAGLIPFTILVSIYRVLTESLS